MENQNQTWRRVFSNSKRTDVGESQKMRNQIKLLRHKIWQPLDQNLSSTKQHLLTFLSFSLVSYTPSPFIQSLQEEMPFDLELIGITSLTNVAIFNYKALKSYTEFY